MKQKLLLVLLLLSVVIFAGCEWRKFEEPEIEYHLVQERISQTESCCTVFDRTTGEVLPLSELFTIPEAEICRTLLDRAQFKDAAVQAKMEKAFLPEYIIFYPDVLEISYPQGALEGYGGWIVAVDYEDIKDILQPWAIPYQEE